MPVVYEDSISGRSVIDASGRVIGEVAGILLDSASWHVEALRVKLHKDISDELGASHGPFRAARLDVPTDFVRDVTDTVVLKGPAGALRTRAALAEEEPAPTPTTPDAREASAPPPGP